MALLLGFFQLQGRARVQLREGQDLGALKSGGRASGLPRTLKVLETTQAPEVVGTDPGGKALGAFWRAMWHQARHGRAEFLMSEGERWGSLTRLIELTDSVICRRLISVSSLQRGKRWLRAHASPFFPSFNGSQPQHTYTSFLCFSLVLASEILLLRFLSRIF